MDDIARGRALLVDDYPPNRLVSGTLLENLGFHVDVADCGEAALEMLSATDEPYTVILMDVQMQALDGIETTRLIRQMEKVKGFHQPILGVTAHTLTVDRERCLRGGMEEYMTKPVHPDILAQKLAKILRPA